MPDSTFFGCASPPESDGQVFLQQLVFLLNMVFVCQSGPSKVGGTIWRMILTCAVYCAVYKPTKFLQGRATALEVDVSPDAVSSSGCSASDVDPPQVSSGSLASSSPRSSFAGLPGDWCDAFVYPFPAVISTQSSGRLVSLVVVLLWVCSSSRKCGFSWRPRWC